MKGYVKVAQWYVKCKTLQELAGDEKVGDAAAADALFGKAKVDIVDTKPNPNKGEIVFRVEDDNALTMVDFFFDSSD